MSEYETRNTGTLNALDAEMDALLGALSHPLRRMLLVQLHESRGPVDLSTMAEELARWSRTGDVDLSTDDSEQMYAALYHRHVPLMVDAGLLEYDSEEDEMKLTGSGDDPSLIHLASISDSSETVGRSER